MDEVVELQKMDNVCRLCLSTDEPKSSVFGTENASVSLASKIQACLSIQILTTDRLSTQICAQCVKNINQWYDYKESCLRSQDKLQQWLQQHMQSSPMVVTIKDEPVDLDFCEDKIEVISESATDSDLEATNLEDSAANHVENNVQELTDDEVVLDKGEPSLTKNLETPVKPEPREDYDTDCTIEIESVTGSELVLNPLSNTEDRVMEADSTQKSGVTKTIRKRGKRGRVYFKSIRPFKQKCVYCQIYLHSKHSYANHMERFHSNKQNGSAENVELQGDEELVEDLEEELMSMEKDAPLTQVQQNIISQLKTFSCYSCQQSFNDRRSTLSHIRQHMPDLRPYTCIACLTEFPDRSMYKSHCGASFECAMKIALVIPKQGEERYFTCNMCLRSMQNRKQLLTHLSRHSDKQYEELISPSRSPPKLKPVTPLPPVKQEIIRKSLEGGLNIPGPYKNGDPAHNHACDLCGMIYRYRPNMLRHRNLCQRLPLEVRTSYRCVHCGMTYLVFKKFHYHITADHKKQEFTCADCGNKYRSPSDYLDHHEQHRMARSKKYPESRSVSIKPIKNISTPFKDWDTFEAEVNADKLSDSNQYSCALCNLEFATRAELTEHRNLHLKVKIYSCVICRSMFSSAGALEIHMKDHGIEDPNERNANISCVEYSTVEDDSLDSNSLNLSAASESGSKKYDCGVCGKIFSNGANLKRHTRNVHSIAAGPYSCPQCLRMFKSKEMCKHHIVTEHTKPEKTMLRCPRCPKTFVFQFNLDLHFQSTHAEKPGGQKCDLCGKEFVEEASLKIHRSWHKRANSRLSLRFLKKEDEVCSDKFNDVTELRKHLWDIHCARNKTEKNFADDEFQCEICTNVFPDRETLDVHMQWHNAQPILSDIQKINFPCEICGKLYSSKKVLSRHKKLHKATTVAGMKFQATNRRQMMCTFCNKVFTNNQSLQRHKLSMHVNLFPERPQMTYNNAKRMSQDEPKPKKIKLEDENKKTPFAMDALTAGRKSVMCHVCRKFFANMSVLYKHKQLVHKNYPKSGIKVLALECIPVPSNDGKVSCNVCHRKFSGVPNLRQHFTVKHKLAPPKYACPIDGCQLTFPSPVTLKNHELSHTSTIFSCNLCDRHVFSKQTMSKHMLTVHNTVYDADHSQNFHREMDLSTYTVEGAVDATCPQCKIKYPNNKAMKIHYFKFHEGADQ
ncbi:Zinc finger protein 91 [Eufriesea mexicana]|uniref:Zinc finger protein 91 n=1 Tax=Eufriesea mexicana TaxID=516756 RepID=A0A310SH35_9HYME|nr:Zinc finger protein 91 [Eufriesea mexicana]